MSKMVAKTSAKTGTKHFVQSRTLRQQTRTVWSKQDEFVELAVNIDRGLVDAEHARATAAVRHITKHAAKTWFKRHRSANNLTASRADVQRRNSNEPD